MNLYQSFKKNLHLIILYSFISVLVTESFMLLQIHFFPVEKEIQSLFYIMGFYIPFITAFIVLTYIFYRKEKYEEILNHLNESLEKRVEKEVTNNLKKEKQLIEQSKMANMGSMIGNIAHQWRQPLSGISVIASTIQMKHEMGILKDDEIEKNMETIIEQTQYLSENINTFRDFLREKKDIQDVILEERITISLNIVGLALKDNSIKLINKIDYKAQTKLKMVLGELSEVIINIINNAKDILLENKIKEPWVQLDLLKDINTVTITIEDNGGGVPSNIIEHIFDEYYTTKPDNIGTGLGLYMSKKIIEDSLGGNLYVKNSEHGAKFFIELPLS